jgi:hypothetical protein
MHIKHLNQPSQELSTSCEPNIQESQPPKPNYFAHIARSLPATSVFKTKSAVGTHWLLVLRLGERLSGCWRAIITIK